MNALTAEERTALRVRHQQNRDLSPRPYCTNNDDVHGDHGQHFADWPCPVIRLLNELEETENELVVTVNQLGRENPRPRLTGPQSTVFDAIRHAQSLRPAYVEAHAELICVMFGLDVNVWRAELIAEISRAHGTYVRT